MREPHEFAPPHDYNAALLKLLACPDLCSKRWVYEQYDTYIGGNSLQRPGGDAGVVRIDDESGRALAFSCDVTPRYVEADPFEGGKQAVAECYRNLISVGAKPLACTDNLNFGNPEKPEVMGQFIAAIGGIGEACLALNMPVASGNVSFYNETNDEAILPTPAIGGVGLIDDCSKMASVSNAHQDAVLFLVGTHATHLSRSLYEREILGEDAGPPPPVDLLMEQARGEFVLAAIRSEYAALCHDISDGGLAVALAEICMASGMGATIDWEMPYYTHAALFGEDQARYIMAVDEEWADMFAANSEGSGVSFCRIGTLGGEKLVIGELIDLEVSEMKKVNEDALPEFINASGQRKIRKEKTMAMEAAEIKKMICRKFPDACVTIRDLAGDGDHYAAEVTTKEFVGKSRVEQHQMVYAALKGNIGEQLHALALQTSVPKE